MNSIIERLLGTPYYTIFKGFDVEKIIFNPPATIVFWGDNTKTVVKCGADTQFNRYFGFCAALAKKVYGSNSRVNRIVNDGITDVKFTAIKIKDDRSKEGRPKTSDTMNF